MPILFGEKLGVIVNNALAPGASDGRVSLLLNTELTPSLTSTLRMTLVCARFQAFATLAEKFVVPV